MDFVFVSMPYAKCDSKWFAHVPNINLGILDALLTSKGKSVRTFHFHLAFLPFLNDLKAGVEENLARLSKDFGVEYLSLDYVFASLLFENHYLESKGRFEERLGALDLTIDDFEELREAGRSFIEFAFSELSPFLKETKLVGFTCSHYQLSGALLMCALIKQAYPHIRTILGGKDCAGAFSHELLSRADFIDYVGVTECEVTIGAVLEHLADETSPLCNVVYRNDKGAVTESERKPNVLMETLPFPVYHFEELAVAPGDLILPLELGRGCPWGKCTFCPDESYGVVCQTKTASRVKEEMDYYQSISKELRNFIILDPDALKDRELVLELSRYLQGGDFSFHFAEFRAERMDREVLESLLRFGHWISHFQVGIESFSDQVLHLMKKGVSALRNVEVLKMVAELGVPLQFNLFTCYPNMNKEDLDETLRVMDLITHLLVQENILIYPGEFYLPTDCPVFLDIGQYNIERNVESIFSDVFEDFPMPSYANYPYPYQFGNEEEQFEIAGKIRETVEEIKNKRPDENFMYYEMEAKGLRVYHCRDGSTVTHTFSDEEKDFYFTALETSQKVTAVSKALGMPLDDTRAMVEDFSRKRLILCSSDGTAFLSLATPCKGSGEG